MTAGSVALVARPRRLRRVCAASAMTVAVLGGVLALLLAGASTGSSVSGGTSTGATFRPADQIAVMLFGLGVAGLLLLGTRPRVEADREGVRVRTIWRTTTLPWALVRAVRFDEGSSWASLDLADDDSVALLAVQRNDGERTEQAVAGLRALHAAVLGATVAAMADLSEKAHPEPPLAGDETATLLGSLERQRATLAWKCGELDAAGMRATLGPSTITLGGLLKHLAHVEDNWFSQFLHGRDPRPPWDTMDWEWDWDSAAEDTPEQVHVFWQDAVAQSRSLVAAALADGGLDQLAHRTWPDGRAPSLRRILIDVIEEYARHVGHADLIRESVDGLTGEDPPG